MNCPDQGQYEHRLFLEQNLAVISEAARHGFHAHGRGAVFVYEDAILDAAAGLAPSVTIEYVPDGSEALVRRGGWPTERHSELVSGYDPERTIIVLVGRRRGGAELFTYQLVAPVASKSVAAAPSWIDELIG